MAMHDGYNNEPNAFYTWSSHHHLGAIDPESCEKMKEEGVLVGVLYIDYISPPEFISAMKKVTPKVLPALKECASEDMFYNATTPSGIAKALSDMLAATEASATPRITQ
ncbi:MAG: hypothetical protein U1E15_08995 [Hyphomicrobiales bacterium]